MRSLGQGVLRLACFYAGMGLVLTASAKPVGQGLSGMPISIIEAKTPLERIPVKASLLTLGMTQEQVEQVMGKPTLVKVFPNADIKLLTLTYANEPLVTLISFADGKVSAVTVQMKVFTDSTLPSFAVGVNVGISRSALIQLLGEPVDAQQSSLGMMQVERLIFRKEEQTLRVLLSDGKVEAFNQQLERPEKILKIGLPTLLDVDDERRNGEKIRIGMSLKNVKAILGKPNYEQTGIYQDQKMMNLVYGKSGFTQPVNLTFIQNILTRYSLNL
jgi:hypothetical protein